MQIGYHIYFDEQSYLILPTIGHLPAKIVAEDILILENPDELAIKSSIYKLDQQAVRKVVVLADNLEETWETFKRQFTLIQAGGGLVKNERDEYLFIFRRGKWDLPKGKLDDGETIAACALREVNEETGLQNITLLNHRCNTYHTYHEREKFVLKESVWYNMECTSGQLLTPQSEEDIVEIKWLKKEDWGTVQENIFSSIKDVLAAV